MQIPLLAIFCLSAAAFFYVAYVVLFAVPKNQASRFRYRLWRLRDDIVDAQISGEIEESPEATQLVEAIEAGIESARDLSPLRFLIVFMFMATSPHLREQLKRHGLPKIALMPKNYGHSFGRLLLKHLLFGSVSGWIFSIVLFGLIMPFALITKRAKSVWSFLEDTAAGIARTLPSGMIDYRSGTLASCM